MQTLYLKNEYEDGTVYFKIEKMAHPEDEYIYDGTEIMIEEDLITKDEYELTEDDLQEMYSDGFENISPEEYAQAEEKHESLDL